MDYACRIRRILFVASFTPALATCGGNGSAEGGSADASTSTGVGATSGGASTGVQYDCTPGDVRCSADLLAVETCTPTGTNWIPVPCPSLTQCGACDPEEDENCDIAARCLGPCEAEEELPSSAGCSFIVNRQLHLDAEAPDGLIVANPNSELVVSVWLYQTPEGTSTEELAEGPVMLAPLETHTFELTTNFVMGDSSMYRTGGTYRAVSDAPIIAYHHAPYRISFGNDSSMLLPESTLRSDYVVMSYSPHVEAPFGFGLPSYFEVVALENFTHLEWTPRADTAGNGLPVPPVAAGETGTLVMNRFDTVRIAASSNDPKSDPDLRDVSGTVVHADKNIWVVGASRCSRVPVRETPAQGFCDPLQELAIPLNYWGTTYVAVASADRCTADNPPACGNERHYWRVYNGKPGTTTVTFATPVATLPAVTNDQFTLTGRGDYFEFSVDHGVSFVLEADGVFMPVQYLQSKFKTGEPLQESTTLGDPAMVQMVPVDEWLSRYVFVTGLGFHFNFVQVVHEQGAAEVLLDGAPIPVGLYTLVGDYSIATMPVTEGAHVVESDDPFGIMQVGYSDNVSLDCIDLQGQPILCGSSYAYPGGMKSVEIYIP